MDQGDLEGNEVESPWHRSHFDVTSGQVEKGPAGRPEPSYEVKVDAGEIRLRPKQ